MLRSRKAIPVNIGSWQLSDLGVFYSTNRSNFLSHATRLLGDSTRAEEVVHEALLKVMLAAPELNSEEHARAYLHRTIENLCIDIFRMEGRRPSLVLIDDAKEEIEMSSIQLDPDFVDSLSRAEDAAIVRQAISLLSAAERAALVMWEIEERSTSEIAKELGIKESAVRHTISRARASLRRILSTMIIDEDLGLTGLDMLSRSYGRAKKLTKKSSKAVLSFIFALVAFAGFNSLSVSEISDLPSNISPMNLPNFTSTPVGTGKSQSKALTVVPEVSKTQVQNARGSKATLKFPGLNKFGVPIGFTIADSTGGMGPAYFRERSTPAVNSYSSTSQIIKTESGAANVFISQSINSNGEGISYSPSVAFGRAGEWIPLLVSVEKSEIELRPDGNYLFTAYIAVESEVDSPIRITAVANGRDLEVSPSRFITRLLLDPSKTLVLLQAVYVIEGDTGA